MLLTDSHCHLDFDAFTQDLPQLLVQCAKQGIHQVIVPSISPDNWQKVLTLCTLPQKDNHPLLYACLGIHPWFLKGLTKAHLDDLSLWVTNHKKNIIAIGEAGIDGVIAKEQNNLIQQQHFFEYQLTLAQQHDLPIIVHHRRSHPEVIALLKKAKLNRAGIIHAFSGSYQQASQYIDLGFKLGIGGTITYPRAIKTIKTIKRLPSSSFVLETDAPSMPLADHQGHPNSPLRLIDVFNCLVNIRGGSAEQLASNIEQTVKVLFNLPEV
ncbi:MAG: TatD DNase family protein [Alteromonadaceae bacterium]|jgi:TatD DNase family protein